MNINKTHSKRKKFTQPSRMTSEIVEWAWMSMVYFLHHLEPGIRKIIKRLESFRLKILKSKQSVIYTRRV